jgi:hypothetical protein
MSTTERDSAREQTAKYRYVKVDLVLVKLVETPPKDVDVKDTTDVIVYIVSLSKPVKHTQKDIKQGRIYKGSCKTGKCPNPFKTFSDLPDGSILK